MQYLNTPKEAGGARVSRRDFFTIAAAGAAATVPAVALAAGGEFPHQLPHLALEQHLDECVVQLRSILQQMRPGIEMKSYRLLSHEGGGISFLLIGDLLEVSE